MTAPHPHRPIGQPPTAFRQRARSSAAAFTLVEILVVITIIGILMGIAIPAITNALRSARTATLRSECNNFEQAIEAYRLKYGDYPPDFSDLSLAERHYRRIFPEILDSELTLLGNLLTVVDTSSSTSIVSPCLLDRGEALVWAVGGFSSNPQKPFTGTGGPLAPRPGATLTTTADKTNPANYQYNSERDNAFMDLDAGQLTVRFNETSGRAESYDELLLASAPVPTGTNTFVATAWRTNDLFPVYRYREDHSPYVYFDARTYRSIGSNISSPSGTSQVNAYVGHNGDTLSVVLPIVSGMVNANIAASAADGTYANPVGTNPLGVATYSTEAHRQFKFVNDNTFQVLSPGLDGVYGSFATVPAGDAAAGLPLYWQYPSGRLIAPDSTKNSSGELIRSEVNKFNSTSWSAASGSLDAFEKDNVANFTERSFEDDLE